MTEIASVGEYMQKLEKQMRELMATKEAVEKNIAELTGFKNKQMTPYDVYQVARKAAKDFHDECNCAKVAK